MLRFLLFLALATVLPVSGAAPRDYDLREGDIVFQGNPGAQSDAIRDATGSPFTHCGVVFRDEGEWWVIEAVQPVRSTPLNQWIARSLPGTYRAYRLKQPLAIEAAGRARAWARRQIGKNYDLKFRWDDGALYCSELVWKLFREAGVDLCERRTFQHYKLDAPRVKAIIDQRYGGIENLPRDEAVVAPGDLAASKLLVEAPLRRKTKR
jgi:cell wall-associated NlpC family hydrolase